MPAGSISLPLAIAAALALALGAAGSGPGSAREDGLVELEVAAVLPLPDGPAGLVVLRDRASGTVLPLLVPDGEALGAGTKAKRAPEGLLGRALDALGARVREVRLDAAEETSAGARVRLVQGAREVEVPARPSESLALALEAGVPILTTRELLQKAGLTPAELHAAHQALSAKPGEAPMRL